MHIGVGDGLIKSHDPLNYFDIIAESKKSEDENGYLGEVEILILDKLQNPTGDEIDVNIKVGSIYINYFPPFAKELVKFIRNLRYVHEYDLQQIIDRRSDEINELQNQIVNTIKKSEEEAFKLIENSEVGEFEYSSHLCSLFPYPYIQFNVSLTEIE